MEIMTQAGQIVVQETAQAAPVSDEHSGSSSRLKDAHSVTPPADTGTVISMNLVADTPYARFLVEGTQAHGPVSAKALRFKIGGQTIYRTWVKGIEPRSQWWSTAVISDRFRNALSAVAS